MILRTIFNEGKCKRFKMRLIKLFHYFLFSLTLLVSIPAIQTSGQAKVYGTSGDEVNCGVYISTYREFFKLKLYKDALAQWRILFDKCQSASEQMYLDGVTMYRSFIEEAPEGPAREGLIDTLMLIYDRRIENFGGEGNVLGRKGRDLLAYRRSDPGSVKEAYGMLKRSFELEKEETQEAVMVLLVSSGMTLYNEGQLGSDQVLGDYLEVHAILDQLVKKSSRWERTMEAVNEVIEEGEILTCENLNSYFEPRYEERKEDKDFLLKMTGLYQESGCNKSELFVMASEQLYAIDPGPQTAHNLAMMFITRNEYEKAAEYLEMAVLGEGIDNDTRAEWFYQLGVVSNANKDYCDAIQFAREAIALKSDYGEAYILLGDVFAASRNNLGDEFEQQTAFWAAADKYAQAAKADPSVAAEANEKLEQFRGLFPGKEDVFFRDLKEGDTYQVKGCINEKTIVRF